MDAGYDADLIRSTSRQLGHVPIIDRNSRGQDIPPMAPHEAERYKERSTAERANARLKEDFGAENIRVKGHTKVPCTLCLESSPYLPTNLSGCSLKISKIVKNDRITMSLSP